MNNLKRTYTKRINGNYVLETVQTLKYNPVKRIKYDKKPQKQLVIKPKNKMTKQDKGEEFEKQVLRKLRSNDIEVTHSRKGKDNGVDMLCNYMGIEMIVQCKDQCPNITEPQISTFEGCVARRVSQLIDQGERIFIGLFVSRRSNYTLPAKAKARSSPYLIITSSYDSMIKDLFEAIKAVQNLQNQGKRKTEQNHTENFKRKKGIAITGENTYNNCTFSYYQHQHVHHHES